MSADFTALPDLASRALSGSVSAANDELFAQRENLIKPGAPFFDPHEFGHKGKVYDGWETRRRRDAGHDYAIVRLGAAGIIHGIIVDTAYFKGNYPPFISIEAASIEGYPSIEEVMKADWQTIVEKSPAQGDTANAYAVSDRHRWTHVRLSIYPDGGVARLRVHGEGVFDAARHHPGSEIDLAAAENGGQALLCSDMFFGNRHNLIMPGRSTHMCDGWETRRRRGPGHDWTIVKLATRGTLHRVELDTDHFKGNAPGRCMVEICDAPSVPNADVQALAGRVGAWRALVHETPLQPHSRHRFTELSQHGPATHVRLNIYPDGGVARLRLFGMPELR